MKFSEPCSVPQSKHVSKINRYLNIILSNFVDYISIYFPPLVDQDIENELSMPQHFDNPFYTPPDCNIPNASMAVPVMDGGVHMPSQVMEEIHYNEDFKQEDSCVSLDPETLDTVLQGISQCLASFRPDQSQQGSDQFLNQLFFHGDLNFGLDGTDTKLNVSQPMMNMSSINDVHFSQMVNENQAYPADLENIEGLVFSPVKSENDLDH